jgi:2-polyprenyl-6-hydroxyphenyl methylase/3-demethylubiquinone-9 3-methyltransferase
MEMLEHVPQPDSVIQACAKLLKPGGRLFLSTLNRTPAAFALAIVGAEYVARVLPKGTHQYRDFIKPSELAKWLRDAGLELEDVSGLMYDPWRNSARVVPRTDINYLACARKPA